MANELRVRHNNMSGVITNNPLAIGGTTLNSPGLADLPTIDATNHMVLILDPQEVGGPAEIVYVTAHTAAAQTATILRAQEGTSPRAHVFNTTWQHGPIASDFFSTAGGDVNVAWQTWPTVLQNITQGNGTVNAKYVKIGRTVHAKFEFAFGTTSVMGTNPGFTLPVAAASNTVSDHPLTAACHIRETGNVVFQGTLLLASSTIASFLAWVVSGTFATYSTITPTSPINPWQAGDSLAATFTYEAAS